MGKLTEMDKWEDDVYQLETSDPVLGGPEGISNKASRQLANRTFWLKKRLEQANEALAQHAQFRDHPDGTLNAKGFVQLSSVTGSDSETLAATPKAIKIAMENANARLAKDRNGADIPNPRLFVSNLGLDDTIDKAANAWPTAVRGTLRNNGAFANCTLVGVYHVAISDASTVADAPAIDGAPINLYGFLYVTNEAAQYSQLFISNYGHIAARVAWNGTGSYRAWSVSYTTTNKQPLPYASLTVSGIVQLSSATDSASEALAATPKAIKIAMDNANARLAKERNGADIPNVELFINNLGLRETVNKAANALPVITEVLSVDLNTLGHIEHAGVYYQNADVSALADKHYPIQLSGTLSVTPSAYGCQQEYTTYSTSRKFMRSLLGVWNGSGPWSPWIEAYSENHKPTPSEISAVPSAGGAVGYLDRANYYDTKPDVVPRGSGGWDSQLNSGAPFYAPNWAWPVKSGGHYVPLVKGVSTRAGIGYPCAVSFGYLLPGDDTWANPVIHAKGDNSECTWQFNINTGEIWSSKAGGMSSQTDAQNHANEAYNRATTWAYQNQVGNVQVSGIWEYVDIPYPGQANVPPGICPVAYVGTTKSTGSGISFHISRIYFCRIQKVINGVAYNIA